MKPVHVMGHLHALWHAAIEQQEDGDLAAWTDAFIAASSCFSGSAPQFVSLLQKHGWLDGKLVHDWIDYAGPYLKSRYHSSNPQRLVDIWKKHGREYRPPKGDPPTGPDRPDQPKNAAPGAPDLPKKKKKEFHPVVKAAADQLYARFKDKFVSERVIAWIVTNEKDYSPTVIACALNDFLPKAGELTGNWWPYLNKLLFKARIRENEAEHEKKKREGIPTNFIELVGDIAKV